MWKQRARSGGRGQGNVEGGTYDVLRDADEEQAHAAPQHGAVPQQARRQRRLLALPPLLDAERDEEDTEADEQADDPWGVPGRLSAPPLQRQQQAAHAAEQQRHAERVEAAEFVREGQGAGGVGRAGQAQEEQQEEEGGEADGEVAASGQNPVIATEAGRKREGGGRDGGGRSHPKAPAPAHAVRQRAAQRRRHARADAERRRHEPDVHGALLHRRDEADGAEAALDDAGRAHARDGAAQDQHLGARRRGAQGGAELEDHDGDEVHGLEVPQRVQLAGRRLQRGDRQQVRGPVPPDLLEGREVRRDGGDGDGDDADVQRDQEGAEREREEHRGEPQAREVPLLGGR